ncbi:ABC transporter ATP-binding protein [Aquibium sp. ELW1220]|uniref:ABC transporter ATP-binding protein n=1 Tax=Aquibium sp. ELW1220 TaxID=2976766 RepID=UPI0025AF5727|nr:ABC transporter ATP-binding protein [Aquibium sp. ELW1220]MDN2579282.1 ABC transporter ATP-binding protein [Aquibium sp. ELW1220]
MLAHQTPTERPASPAPLLSLRGVGKAFSNGVTALSGVDMTIRQGDFVSLLGPSGCGKSTALRIVAGLSSPTTGTLDWHSEPIGQRDLGFVFQEPTLMPWASVFDNVWLPLRLRGVSRSEAAPQIAEMLERVHLTGFENAVPRELSGGMKMRVSIARSLVTRPKLLLMDEPFAALDEITRFKLNDDILELWQDRKLTVVFVTHSVFESVFLSNRIIVMAARPGRVHGEFGVDAPYPRDERFRTSAAYAALCRDASEALLGAINASHQSSRVRA